MNLDDLYTDEEREQDRKEWERRQEPTAEGRYAQRKPFFAEDGAPFPRLRHHAFWLLHNCIAHPLLALGAGLRPLTPGVERQPSEKLVAFHELTSHWLNHKSSLTWSPMRKSHFWTFDADVRMPVVTNRAAWIKHNVLAHLAIGLLPCRATFEFHDKTAKEMNVEGWV